MSDTPIEDCCANCGEKPGDTAKLKAWKILVYPLVINLGEVNSCLFVLGLTSNVCRRSYIFM